jgi:hypothetical protein
MEWVYGGFASASDSTARWSNRSEMRLASYVRRPAGVRAAYEYGHH